MEKFYLDYNSTSPLADSVKEWLKSDDLPFANPSSIHQSGKRARKYIDETTTYLKELFGAQDFKVFYHSGASEGINTIIKGFPKSHVFCSSVDHASALKAETEATLHTFPVDFEGQIDKEKLIAEIKSCKGPVLINFTWVNNVTGVVWDLELAEEIKNETGASIHVDAVQVPGKIENWKELNPNLDFYTFSGHKFGSLKGVGVTLFKKDFNPLINGGGQQGRVRSGTENAVGVYSLKLALEELDEKLNSTELKKAKEALESSIKEYGTIVAEKAERNNNTILFLQDLEKPEIVQMAFDLAGLELGTGSACSSGIQVPDRILLAHGFSEADALKGFRLSLGPYANLELIGQVWDKMKPVLDKFR